MGHLKLIFARGGGNLKKLILNSSIPERLRGKGGYVKASN